MSALGGKPVNICSVRGFPGLTQSGRHISLPQLRLTPEKAAQQIHEDRHDRDRHVARYRDSPSHQMRRP